MKAIIAKMGLILSLILIVPAFTGEAMAKAKCETLTKGKCRKAKACRWDKGAKACVEKAAGAKMKKAKKAKKEAPPAEDEMIDDGMGEETDEF